MRLRIPVELGTDVLELSEAERALALYEPECPYVLLIDDVSTSEELLKHVNKRGFTETALKFLRSSQMWELHYRNLDDSSLAVFEKNVLPVTRIVLRQNKFTQMPALRL